MVGHAAHGGLLLLGLGAIPAGQGQIQLPGGKLGVFVEHLVEVAETEKQNAVLIAFLDLLILPLHGSQFICGFCHGRNLFLLFA